MGKRGRRPLPTKILRLRGSRWAAGRSAEPSPPPGVPPCPPWLSRAALPHWSQLVESLEPHGILTIIDGWALGLVAEALSMYEQARAAREKARAGARLAWSRAVNAAHDRVLKGLQEFGLTPRSRPSVKSTVACEQKDPLSAFVASKRGDEP